MGDALPTSRALARPKETLVRLFGARTPAVFETLALGSDAGMHALFDGAVSAAVLIDCEGRIARANPALRAMLVADADLSPGAAAVAMFVPEDRAAAWRTLQVLLAGHEPERRLAARLRLADLAPDRRADIGCRPIHEKDGTISGLLLHITDITTQVRLEAQLARSQELENVGHLVGGVAHDFNNLLTAILGAVELAQERDLAPATLVELEHIRRSAERGAALVHNLLALGRQQYLQTEPLDVNAALQGFAAGIRPILGKDVILDLALEQPGRRVRADPGQLDRVLTNLAMNARHAMPDGGRLTLRSGHATLYRHQVHGRETIAPGRYVTISVEDTGIGIPPELQGRIFDPFFTTRRAQGGSGLGLASALGIVRQTGGFLTVASEVGRGTAFRIYLPREEATAPEADPATPPTATPATAAPAAGKATVRHLLLVDDEDSVRRITARALARHGWQVLEAESAEAAVALLDANPAIALTALVSDVVMPGKDGAALVDEVRDRYPALPAILVSGYAETLLAERTIAEAAFLGKPYTPKTLLNRLDEVAPPGTASIARTS
jgi:two-component system cell cycle sensor histidine kinase/response regulator CckA